MQLHIGRLSIQTLNEYNKKMKYKHWQQTRWYAWIYECGPSLFALLAFSCSRLDCIGRWLMFDFWIRFPRSIHLNTGGFRWQPTLGYGAMRREHYCTPDSSHAPVATNNTNCIAFCHCTDVDSMTRRASTQLTCPFLDNCTRFIITGAK